MSKLPPTPELGVFFGRLVDGTRKGRLKWTEVIAGQSFLAVLGKGYAVLLERVPDLTTGDAKDPDYKMTVHKDGLIAFSFDRRDIDMDGVSSIISSEHEVAHPLIEEMWNRAIASAMKLDQHLSALNEVLGEK
jgi:hypothetical protein